MQDSEVQICAGALAQSVQGPWFTSNTSETKDPNQGLDIYSNGGVLASKAGNPEFCLQQHRSLQGWCMLLIQCLGVEAGGSGAQGHPLQLSRFKVSLGQEILPFPKQIFPVKHHII